MPSLVTSVVGGIQGASAAHNAANAAKAGYDEAGTTVQTAATNANKTIADTVNPAAANVVAAGYNAGDTAMTTAGQGAKSVTDAGATAAGGMSPYISTGAKASNTIGGMIDDGSLTKGFTGSDLTSDPGYLFRLQQGQQAIARSQAATGGALGGSALKALNSYSQGVASDEYGKAFDRFQTNRQNVFGDLATASGQGLNASQYAGNVGVQTAENAAGQNNEAAEYAGKLGFAGATTAGGMQMDAADREAGNTYNAGVYQGNTKIGAANSIAQGDLGAAKAWNGMLSGIGAVADGFAGGGLKAGGGFNLGNAIKGATGFSV